MWAELVAAERVRERYDAVCVEISSVSCVRGGGVCAQCGEVCACERIGRY